MKWSSEAPIEQDRHGQGLPCAFYDGRYPHIKYADENERHVVVHGTIVCRRCLGIVEQILRKSKMVWIPARSRRISEKFSMRRVK